MRSCGSVFPATCGCEGVGVSGLGDLARPRSLEVQALKRTPERPPPFRLWTAHGITRARTGALGEVRDRTSPASPGAQLLRDNPGAAQAGPPRRPPEEPQSGPRILPALCLLPRRALGWSQKGRVIPAERKGDGKSARETRSPTQRSSAGPSKPGGLEPLCTAPQEGLLPAQWGGTEGHPAVSVTGRDSPRSGAGT